MRKIIITTFMTMDGVLQAPGGPTEDPTHGFKWGGWSAPYGDEVIMETLGKIMAEPFDLLLGRFTYDIFSAYWPYVKDNPIAEKFSNIEKFVVSGKPIELTWAKSTLITGDVVAGLKELKKQDGPNLLVHGSSKLVQTLLANGLADQLHIWTYPITLGKGKRLFGEGTQPAAWKLTEIKHSTTGVILASYEPSGEVKIGDLTNPEQEPSAAEIARRERIAKEV
ncbi:dihydrofolate reductase [Chitinophaga sp. SYP-B3965]|uniref:dihydrofolate reductase family protein n=1 Tax=Chitinophaga sp. SYP-B3965 TaxID=2663120 RepID=UPI0012995D2E|nr:dihydrofolate reductase family protein [Chitinophaga sp. SYP-B3965]MRG44619.1 dihydrofolate reductase [Chitinophaga sp. SYP-B3965]